MEQKIDLNTATKDFEDFLKTRKNHFINWDEDENKALKDTIINHICEGRLIVDLKEKTLEYILDSPLKGKDSDVIKLKNIKFKSRLTAGELINAEKGIGKKTSEAEIELRKVSIATDVSETYLKLLQVSDYIILKILHNFFIS